MEVIRHRVMGLQKLPHGGKRLHKAQPPLRGTANDLVWLAHAVCFGGLARDEFGEGGDVRANLKVPMSTGCLLI